MRGASILAALAAAASLGAPAPSASTPADGPRASPTTPARNAPSAPVAIGSPSINGFTRWWLGASGRLGPPRAGGYRNRAGWTNRRYQRAALKRRNQIKNRRAHRG